MREFFPTNLKYLCNHYRSISDVCRRLDIHRGQFNKYLSGSSFPSAFTLKRICDFFGMEEYEMALPCEQFSRLVNCRERPDVMPRITPSQKAFEFLQQQSSPLVQSWAGCYREYTHSMETPGTIQCSFVKIQEVDGQFVFERIERLRGYGRAERGDVEFRYQGIVYYLGSRLFLLEYDFTGVSEINQTILIPGFKSRRSRLNGLKIGVTSCDHRTPVCTRVVWESISDTDCPPSDCCGLDKFDVEDKLADTDLRERLSQTTVIEGLFRML